MELMIQAYEGQRAHNAMIDALVAEELRRQSAEREKIEARKAEERSREMRELRMRLAMSRAQNEKILNQLIMKDDRAYRPPERRPVADALWGLYGLMVLTGGALADAGRAAWAFAEDGMDVARGIRERMKRNRRARARRKRRNRRRARR